ncbi:MAG: DUF1365 domain-containing protein [Luteolibacter sp.]
MHQEHPAPENSSYLASLAVQNSIYECTVGHTRISPKNHAFTYRVFMLCIDLDDFPKSPLLSKNRFNLFSLHNKDHIHTDPEKSIRENLTDWLSTQNIPIPSDAKITLLTFPRILGYSFNPVSFYYIHSKFGTPITAVAEVTNTFREMKLYPVSPPTATEPKWKKLIPKDFYVSPFSDPNDSFNFRLGTPGESWQIHIDNITEGTPTLLSNIQGTRKPLTTTRLAWFTIRYPLLTLRIILGIHYHALLLYLKKIPFFPKSTPIKYGEGVSNSFQPTPALQPAPVPQERNRDSEVAPNPAQNQSPRNPSKLL